MRHRLGLGFLGLAVMCNLAPSCSRATRSAWRLQAVSAVKLSSEGCRSAAWRITVPASAPSALLAAQTCTARGAPICPPAISVRSSAPECAKVTHPNAMNETNPSSEPEPPEPDWSPHGETSPNSFDELDDLRKRNARLNEQLEHLTEQLAQTELRLSQLSAYLAADAEDLQPFGGTYLKPSAVTSVTFSTGDICINDHPIKTQEEIPHIVWQQMEAHVQYINSQNAKRRREAGPD